MTLTHVVVAGLAALALFFLYALLAARAWQCDYQNAIEAERMDRHERERTL
jgi:hypothetical protein